MRDIKARQGNRQGMRKAKRERGKKHRTHKNRKRDSRERAKEGKKNPYKLRMKRQGEDRREQRGRGLSS